MEPTCPHCHKTHCARSPLGRAAVRFWHGNLESPNPLRGFELYMCRDCLEEFMQRVGNLVLKFHVGME